nr:Gcv operon activator [Klebsiella pneumoniae]
MARLGSVTQAAHELSVTHSAVSQHIKQLEARSASRSLSATAAECASRKKDGSMPCKSARRYSTSPTPRAWCRSNPAPGSDPGDAPSFGCHWLLPRLARFQARHPQIAVRLLTSRRWLTCNRRVSIWPFAWGKAIGRNGKPASVCR